MNNIVSMIDHAVLQPTQNDADVRDACKLCDELKVASICVKPSQVPLARIELRDSPVLVSTVIGFPHGGTSTTTKVAETIEACSLGAREVDMVVNLGKVYSGDWDYVLADIRAVVEAAAEHESITKVIFETGLLDDPQKIKLCELSEEAKAAFVKTSTGFGYKKNADGQLVGTGATTADVALMRKHTSDALQVKASGGVRNFADALKFVELGATRLGTSSTAAIAAGASADSDY
ncbi:deoxyribose-phosphate aldolase [Aeoliella sp. ICT_H6.2]|uniref:Deoxyribose-phosphate aldolase n=1 Tax=Aeoliella straminimaris TaxID=2954799 RepID=A0A9X2JJ88_9BACT|nr:deoxyribose-phosphate aldolase [Aeoliella straminimaris]MCO6047606.1 deoxyribose-phosphate aldolase [Aeoliella straminimaris]